MKDDIRYSEFLFLRALERHDSKFEYIFINQGEQQGILGLQQRFYMQMVVALAEDGYIDFDEQSLQVLIGRVRGEIALSFRVPSGIHDFEWGNPRACLEDKLISGNAVRVRLTYRGLCRIEELRECLRRDRILEPFGVLLDLRYFPKDFEEALRRPGDVPVSVMRLDMDNFKRINDKFGHTAGDVVMKSFLESVRDSIGSSGDAYRGRGDEIAALIVGLEHKGATAVAEKIRWAVENQRYEYKGNDLPSVTTSIGVATTPPEIRSKDLEILADQRQYRAKNEGKNRVVAC